MLRSGTEATSGPDPGPGCGPAPGVGRAAIPALGPTFAPFAILCVLISVVFMFIRIGGGRGGELFSGDGFGYYAYLPTLVIDRDLDFSDQLTTDRIPHGPDDPTFHFLTSKVTGRRANVFPVGPALIWAPWFLLAHVTTLALNRVGFGLPADGYGLNYEVPAYLGGELTVLAGIFYLYKLIFKLYGRPASEAAVLMAVLGTPFILYQFVFLHMSHGFGAAALSIFLYLCTRAREATGDTKVWGLLGFMWGLMFLIRWQDSLYGVIGVALLARQWADGLSARRALLCAALYGGVALLMTFPQLAVWKVLFGSYITIPQNQVMTGPEGTSRYFNPGRVGLDRMARVFFDTRSGVVTPTPNILFGLVGLFIARRRHPVISWAGIVLILAQAFVGGMTQDWWGGVGFANRRMADAMPLVAVGIAGLLDHAERRGRVLGRLLRGALVVSTCWTLAWFLEFLLRMRSSGA